MVSALSGLNWEKFLELPGDARTNFEAVSRAATWRNFTRYGRFAAHAQQPGVEFHLTIDLSGCELGGPDRKYGWQTKWWDIQAGRAIGEGRKKDVLDSIDKTTKHVHGVTDWVLWTRRHLTPADQAWFYGLNTGMRMHLWTEEDLDGLLIGDAQLLRESYFGDLVFTPHRLEAMHEAAAAEVGGRWLPQVHQPPPAETTLRRMLAEPDVWATLAGAADNIARYSAAVSGHMKGLDPALAEQVTEIITIGSTLTDLLKDADEHLKKGQATAWLGAGVPSTPTPVPKVPQVLRRLRADQHLGAPALTNLIAHVRDAFETVLDVRYHLETRVIAVTGDAGYGKTQLAATLAAPCSSRPAGILLHGNRLGCRDTLDHLAGQISIAGRPASSFEELLAAADAAAARAGCRLPVVIDGLNEAESATRWAPLLRRLLVTLENYPSVLVVCTVRGAFLDVAVPDEVKDVLELTGFDESLNEAVKRYFTYYMIEPGDAELPLELVNHPLTLAILCQVTNPTRTSPVSADRIPNSLSAMFEAYLKDVALRIAELRPHIAPTTSPGPSMPSGANYGPPRRATSLSPGPRNSLGTSPGSGKRLSSLPSSTKASSSGSPETRPVPPSQSSMTCSPVTSSPPVSSAPMAPISLGPWPTPPSSRHLTVVGRTSTHWDLTSSTPWSPSCQPLVRVSCGRWCPRRSRLVRCCRPSGLNPASSTRTRSPRSPRTSPSSRDLYRAYSGNFSHPAPSRNTHSTPHSSTGCCAT